MLDVVGLTSEFADLPAPTVPYFFAAKDGFFLHKPTLIGEVLLKQKEMPTHLKEVGEYKNGMLKFNDALKIDAKTFSQAVDFMRQVYTRDQTEAEVIVLYNAETKAHSLFIPWQFNTGASVDSVFDIADVPDGNSVIGTIHSHPGMGAFHSSTDVNDADDFNGIHITVGEVETDKPEYASMVMINEVEFPIGIERTADTSDLNTVAPEDWLKFILQEPRDILLVNFKTLSNEAIDDFIKRATPYPLTPINDNKNTPKWNGKGSYGDYSIFEDDDWWDKLKNKSKNKWPTASRWSEQVKRTIPADFLDWSGKIKAIHIEAVIDHELDQLFKLAEKYGIYLEYNMVNIEEKYPTKVKKVK